MSRSAFVDRFTTLIGMPPSNLMEKSRAVPIPPRPALGGPAALSAGAQPCVVFWTSTKSRAISRLVMQLCQLGVEWRPEDEP
jgi:hypothetical protein